MGLPLSGYSADSTSIYELRAIDYKIKKTAFKMLNDSIESNRYKAFDSVYLLINQALEIKGSADFNFDSSRVHISIIESENKKVQIFSWTTFSAKDSFSFGAVLVHHEKKKINIINLYDSSSTFEKEPHYKTLKLNQWYGALYYGITYRKYKKQYYYTLIGWDGYTRESNRKILDVLVIDQAGKMKFGAPIFKVSDKKRPLNRVIFEFSNQASMVMRYEKSRKVITFENLIPPDNNAKGIYSLYIPDGSYDYFKWKRGVWIKNEMLFYDGFNIPTE